jgi:hypothetical protein
LHRDVNAARALGWEIRRDSGVVTVTRNRRFVFALDTSPDVVRARAR